MVIKLMLQDKDLEKTANNLRKWVAFKKIRMLSKTVDMRNPLLAIQRIHQLILRYPKWFYHETGVSSWLMAEMYYKKLASYVSKH